MSLDEKSCVPCQGGIPPLSRDEAETFLKHTPEWKLIEDGHAISRSFTFKNFKESQAFVNQVGEVAESQGHHPDIRFGWGYADICIQTHKIDGLHENDFILAAKIDALG